MNFLLKIIEGPNKGATVALVDGVAVKLGKGDDCDIVLADPTMPEKAFVLEASESGVTLDGSPLELLHVKTAGDTSFAVGPASSSWGELVWEEKAETPEPEAEAKAEESATEAVPPPEENAKEPAEEPRKSHVGCFVASLLLLVVALIAIWWLLGDVLVGFVKGNTGAGGEVSVIPASLADVARKYSLVVEERDGREVLFGNLRTRAARLAATAEAYEAKPWVEVDLTDDESFKSSADDALFTLTEGAINVVVATNRVLELSGTSHSADSLTSMLKALNSDIPKLKDVDVTRVRFSSAVPKHGGEDGQNEATGLSVGGRKSKKKPGLSLPVCGILTTPYPCLVMQNGARVLEGATIGDGLILKIEADAVTVSNSTGVAVWKL